MKREIQAKMKTAIEAARRGDFEDANSLFYEISQLEPQYANAWFWRAVTSRSPQEILEGLSQAIQLEPDNRSARKLMYKVMKGHLEKYPFLRYDMESDQFYIVGTTEEQKITIPKERSTPTPYPPQQPAPLEPVYRWLWLSCAGLLMAGFGAMAGALISFLIVLNRQRQPLTEMDRKRLKVAQIWAGLLFLLGFCVSFIFIIHI